MDVRLDCALDRFKFTRDICEPRYQSLRAVELFGYTRKRAVIIVSEKDTSQQTHRRPTATTIYCTGIKGAARFAMATSPASRAAMNFVYAVGSLSTDCWLPPLTPEVAAFTSFLLYGGQLGFVRLNPQNRPIVEHADFTAISNNVPSPFGASLTRIVIVDLAYRLQRYILKLDLMCERLKSVAIFHLFRLRWFRSRLHYKLGILCALGPDLTRCRNGLQTVARIG